MNLKQIDAALGAYRTKLDDSDNARLDFFRTIWGVQDDIASEVDSRSAYEVPDVKSLHAWFCAQEAVLAHAPAHIDADAFATAISRIGSCLAKHGSFPEAVIEGFAATKWSRIVAASDIDLAGSDPAAYLETFGELLVDDGLNEDVAYVGMLAASFALRSFLEGVAKAIAAAHSYTEGSEPHALACPVCGAEAAVARVGDTQAVQGRGKELWCAQCGTAWSFERVRCGRCGTQNQAHLHYFNVEGDEAHRLAICDECGGYIRTVYQEDALAPFAYEVEDVVMTRLDAIAADPTFAGGAALSE